MVFFPFPPLSLSLEKDDQFSHLVERRIGGDKQTESTCSLDLVPSPTALLLCPPTLTRAGSSEAGPPSIEGSISFSYPPWWHAACTTGVGEVPTNREEPSRAERMSRSGGFCCFQHQFYFWACSQTSPTLLSAQCVSTLVLADSPF